MIGIIRTFQAKRAIYAELAPFLRLVEREETSGAWMEPHIIGFLATLVTRLAQDRAPNLSSQAMASIQATVLSRLTGAGQELIGERIALFSSLDDPRFAAGCQGALAFMAARNEVRSADASLSASAPGLGCLADIWCDHTQAFLAADRRR